jgi:hypothetical protein
VLFPTKDWTPPTLSDPAGDAPICLWPPNYNWFCWYRTNQDSAAAQFNAGVTDNCDYRSGGEQANLMAWMATESCVNSSPPMLAGHKTHQCAGHGVQFVQTASYENIATLNNKTSADSVFKSSMRTRWPKHRNSVAET